MGRTAHLVGITLVAAALLGVEPTSRRGAQIDPAPAALAPVADAALAPAPGAALSPLRSEPSAPATPSPARDIVGARIVIDRIGIDVPLDWGDIARDVPRDNFAGATPERLALVFPGSALPGTGGNTYIYSHARSGMFITLWNIRVGDAVDLRWPDATLHYIVQRVVPRVSPTDTSWLDPHGPERLTLQTSTGPVASDPRFVAIAVPRAGPR